MPHILVASCSAYSDAWHPFAELFQKFWPDCPYPKHLFSDRPAEVFYLKGFDLRYAPDEGWIPNLLRELNTLERERPDCKTCIVLQEDFFLCYPVVTETVNALDEWLIASEFDSVRLMPCPGAEPPAIFSNVGVIAQAARYRISCQAAIWKIPFIKRLCETILNSGGTTAMDFEHFGTRLSSAFKLASWIRNDDKHLFPLSYHVTGIVRGKWLRGALDFCAANGIDVPHPLRRPVQE